MFFAVAASLSDFVSCRIYVLKLIFVELVVEVYNLLMIIMLLLSLIMLVIVG